MLVATACPLLVGLVLAASPNPHLESAEQLIASVQYAPASKELAKAREVKGNDHSTLVRLLELTGAVQASLGDKAAAVQSFRELVAVEPQFKLGQNWGPKVRGPFYEAKGWVDEHGTLSLKELPAQAAEGKVQAVAVKVAADPLKLAASVRIHAGEGEPVAAPLSATGEAQAAVPAAPEVRWWAELLDAREAVLTTLGSPEEPRVASAAPAPTAEAKPAEVKPAAKPAEPAAVAQTQVPTAESSPPLRPVAYALAGAGAAALGAGAFFGYQSRQADSKLANTGRDAQGRETGLSQREAYALDAKAASNARLANILFGVGGAALAAGAGLWIYGQVAAVPTPNGVAVAGVIP